jgi:hypothetical protein
MGHNGLRYFVGKWRKNMRDEDVVQWWGVSANVDRLKGTQRVIQAERIRLFYRIMISLTSIKDLGKGKAMLDSLGIKIGG